MESQIKELQVTGDYYSLQVQARILGTYCKLFGSLGIFWGIIGFLISVGARNEGLGGFSGDIIFPISFFIDILMGGFLLMMGGLAQKNSIPKSYRITGIAQSIVGTWNILITIYIVYIMFFIYYISPVFILISVYAIFTGVLPFYFVKESLSLIRHLPAKPSDQELKEMETIIKSINDTKPSESSHTQGLIWFNNTDRYSKYKFYCAKLTKSYAIIVALEGAFICFARPEEFLIVDRGRSLFPNRRNIEVQIKDTKFGRCLTSPAYLQRYEQWKNTIRPQCPNCMRQLPENKNEFCIYCGKRLQP